MEFGHFVRVPTTTHEPHYTSTELGREWHCSANTVRRLCEEFGGVICLDRPEECHKRGYKSVRIPASTADRIYAAHFAPRLK